MASTGISSGTFRIHAIWHHRKGEELKLSDYGGASIYMRLHDIVDMAIRDAAVTGKPASITLTVEMNNDPPTAKGRPRAAGLGPVQTG